jgi:hypothetical protein
MHPDGYDLGVNEMKHKITLDQPLIYQIKISGQLSENWLDWMEEMVIEVNLMEDGSPVTTLTGTFDQAALHGLLRRLYYLGFPLISVNYIRSNEKESL